MQIRNVSMYADHSRSCWEELYTAAMFELNQDTLCPLISAAKMAVCDRVEELDGKGSLSERMALNKAMKALCELQDLYCSGSSIDDAGRKRQRIPGGICRS